MQLQPQANAYYFLRWRIRARIRRFLRPIFLLPLPVFFTPTRFSPAYDLFLYEIATFTAFAAVCEAIGYHRTLSLINTCIRDPLNEVLPKHFRFAKVGSMSHNCPNCGSYDWENRATVSFFIRFLTEPATKAVAFHIAMVAGSWQRAYYQSNLNSCIAANLRIDHSGHISQFLELQSMLSRPRLCFLVSGLLFFQAGSADLAVAADEYELKMVDNSTTFSQAIAINSKLEILGTREVAEGPGSAMKTYFRSGDKDVLLNPPKDFTNLEPQALSDTSLVVGYVSRPVGNENGSLRGFVWDAKTGELTTLDPLPTDVGSHAQDISADGKRITGYSTGHTPARLRPCVWQWQEE